MIGHEKEEKDCKENRIDNETIGRLQDEVCAHYMFQNFRAAIDKRPKEIECKKCEKIFVNRLQREHHDMSVHGGVRSKDFAMESFLSGLVKTQETFMSGFADTMKVVVTNNTEKKPVTTMQITKAKLPPIWIGGDFERFKEEIEAWDKNNADSSMTKYAALIESLKKNKNIKENDINVILDNAREIGDKTVKKVIKI